MNTFPLGRNSPPRLAFTLSEFCQAVGLSRTAAYAAIACGELQTLKIGRRRLVRATAAEAWLDAHEMNMPSAMLCGQKSVGQRLCDPNKKAEPSSSGGLREMRQVRKSRVRS